MSPDQRLLRVDTHDDGLNSWSMARIAPPRMLGGVIDGYTFYSERTASFSSRPVARIIGWSRKHLAARTHDSIGVGPRSFRRLLRFRRLTDLLAARTHPGWAMLAAEANYCDQSHMIRDFREFAGLTPSAFLARSLPDGGGLVEY